MIWYIHPCLVHKLKNCPNIVEIFPQAQVTITIFGYPLWVSWFTCFQRLCLIILLFNLVYKGAR